MKFAAFIILLLLSTFCYSQSVTVIKITDLEKRIYNTSDTTYIINFWATWCAPCIKELPDFDSIHLAYQKEKVKVILVSVDFKEDLEKKVIPFVEKKKIKSEVMLLDETNANYFIQKISNDWTGDIPGTLILNNTKNKKLFFEKKLDFNFLKEQIESIK